MSKYSHLSREDLIGLLTRRDASRRLGLVWERDEVEHDRSLNDEFVTVELDQGNSVGMAPYENLVIEGDNFDALRHLRLAYRGRVKCIYIDPPYNTGNSDFIYNDSFVDREDGFRHSKWLEFMYQRLLLARDLLAPDGVIFVSIDDNEQSHLSLLMEQIMPGGRVGTFVWRRRSGANDEKEWFISVDHEYVLCYANPQFSFAGTEKALEDYSNPDGDPRGPWVSGDLVKAHTIKQRPDAFYPIMNPATDVWYMPDPDNVWRFATEERSEGKRLRTKSMEQQVAESRVLWPQANETVCYESLEELQQAIATDKAPAGFRIYDERPSIMAKIQRGELSPRLGEVIPPIEFWVGKTIGLGKPRFKRFAADLRKSHQPVSTWILPAATKKAEREDLAADEVNTLVSGYTTEGTKSYSQIMGNKDFAFTKPLSLIKNLINQATSSDQGDIVLDFFAGSGTTGQAVLELNQEDDGNRRFVLVSSTEATEKEPDKNLCRDVLARRLNRVIDGYSYRSRSSTVNVPPVPGEFAYLRAHRIEHQRLLQQLRHDQIWISLQEIHSASVSPFDPGTSLQILEGREGSHDLIYVSEVSPDSMSELEIVVMKDRTPRVIYTWQPALVAQSCDVDYLQILRIPDALVQRFGGAN